MTYKEVENQEELITLLKSNKVLIKYAFQNLDFSQLNYDLSKLTFNECLFLGCNLPSSLLQHCYLNNYIFPELNMPYNSYINHLYTKELLYDKYNLGSPESYTKCLDFKIYDHFIKTGKEANDIKETLARRLHDHSITDALYDFLDTFPDDKKVAIMGGHSLSRASQTYLNVALISKELTERGYLMISGGGPGAMEATHVGAWFAGKPTEDLQIAIEILITAPSYKDQLWLDTAIKVIETFPNPKYESLGIPTWLYGHEPPTPFATKIAKYFANSVREDGLLAIAKGGIIFTPGSAGTIQEIFQDATQNHYLSFDVSSPMIFLDKKYWTIERPIYTILEQMNNENKYNNLLLSITDNNNEVINKIEQFKIPDKDLQK